MNHKTYRELISANGGNAVEVSLVTEDGLNVTASCWTDDEEILDDPATFSIFADWEITSRSPISQIDEIRLHDAIVDKVGGEWYYSAADLYFHQI